VVACGAGLSMLSALKLSHIMVSSGGVLPEISDDNLALDILCLLPRKEKRMAAKRKATTLRKHGTAIHFQECRKGAVAYSEKGLLFFLVAF